MPIKFANFKIQTYITFQQILRIRKTKSRSQHITIIDRREKKSNCEYGLEPHTTKHLSAPVSIYRIATKCRFQLYGLSLYQEIRKKQLKTWKKNQASIECQSKITSVKYQNQLISDMGDHFYVNYYLFYFFSVRISRVGFAD